MFNFVLTNAFKRRTDDVLTIFSYIQSRTIDLNLYMSIMGRRSEQGQQNSFNETEHTHSWRHCSHFHRAGIASKQTRGYKEEQVIFTIKSTVVKLYGAAV